MISFVTETATKYMHQRVQMLYSVFKACGRAIPHTTTRHMIGVMYVKGKR